jgi:hypothetical protein
MKRFEEIGLRIMQRAGAPDHDAIARVLADPWKRSLASRILGQAYMHAYHVVKANKAATERVADALIERRELHGDEVVELLDSCELVKPEVDLLDDDVWPRL